MTTDDQEPITLDVQDGHLGQDARDRADDLRSLVEEELLREYDLRPYQLD